MNVIQGRKLTGLTVIIVLLSLLIGQQAAAQNISAGCDALNGPSATLGGTSEGWQILDTEFFAGDTLNWNITVEGLATSYFVQVVDNGSGAILVDQFSSILGDQATSGSYAIPATGSYDVGITGYGVDVTAVEASCIAGAPNNGNGQGPPSGMGNGQGNNGNGLGNQPPSAPTPPDSRANFGFGDLYAVIYSAIDAEGFPEVQVYCYDDEIDLGTIAFTVMVEDVDITQPVGVATLVASVSSGDCDAQFWILPDGTFQINLNTPEGKIFMLNSDDLNFDDALASYFDPNE